MITAGAMWCPCAVAMAEGQPEMCGDARRKWPRPAEGWGWRSPAGQGSGKIDKKMAGTGAASVDADWSRTSGHLAACSTMSGVWSQYHGPADIVEAAGSDSGAGEVVAAAGGDQCLPAQSANETRPFRSACPAGCPNGLNLVLFFSTIFHVHRT